MLEPKRWPPDYSTARLSRRASMLGKARWTRRRQGRGAGAGTGAGAGAGSRAGQGRRQGQVQGQSQDSGARPFGTTFPPSPSLSPPPPPAPVTPVRPAPVPAAPAPAAPVPPARVSAAPAPAPACPCLCCPSTCCAFAIPDLDRPLCGMASVSSNRISDAGASALADGLIHCPALATLEYARVLGPFAAQARPKLIICSRRACSWGGNRIGVAGVRALVARLKHVPLLSAIW